MGNILSISPEQYDDNQNLLQIKITLKMDKPVHEELKQLLNWSLEEIRNIYAPFRKRKSSPILTRSEFLRFVRLSRITSFHIYDEICKADIINAFEVMSILILTAHTTLAYKIQCKIFAHSVMFNVFDLMSTKNLKFGDLILMFKSVVRGYAILTNQELPDIHLLQKYAQTIFSRADLNNDQNLELSEQIIVYDRILSWVEENKDAKELFKRFEPEIFGKQDYHIFTSFAPYEQDEIQILVARIQKVHHSEKLQSEDYQLLNKTNKLPKAYFGKENIQKPRQSAKNKDFDQVGIQSSLTETSFYNKMIFSNKSETFSKNLKLPAFKGFESTIVSNDYKQRLAIPGKITGSRYYQDKYKKHRFNNIIIIKGRTITKKEIFDLRQYFDKLSGGKDSILIEDFIESFSQEKYNHMKSVAASLYNFLDHDQNGKVSFKQLILKIYPNLSSKHISIIDSWSDEYNQNFNIKNKIKINRHQDQTKKRILPKTCLPRFKEMFQSFDSDKKGFVTYDDIKRVLSQVCSQKQMQQLFEDSDRDKDGKLTLQQFANVLLPSDLQIEGLQ